MIFRSSQGGLLLASVVAAALLVGSAPPPTSVARVHRSVQAVESGPLVESLSIRIHRFLLEHGAQPEVASEMAPLFAASRRPRIMAAIAIAESNCDPHAVGRDGEVSMFQILVWPGGDPTDNAHALRVAEGHLEQKIVAAGGRLWDGVRRDEEPLPCTSCIGCFVERVLPATGVQVRMARKEPVEDR